MISPAIPKKTEPPRPTGTTVPTSPHRIRTTIPNDNCSLPVVLAQGGRKYFQASTSASYSVSLSVDTNWTSYDSVSAKGADCLSWFGRLCLPERARGHEGSVVVVGCEMSCDLVAGEGTFKAARSCPRSM
jgi:hypothetical protein